MDDGHLVRYTAKQLASSLINQIALARGLTAEDLSQLRQDISRIHFHDSSQNEIAWNDVQAVMMYNAVTGENIPVPAVATEGYNQHGHTSQFDGGYIPGMGPHDHRDNFHGGYCFAVMHPGTALPQMPWAL